MKKQCLTGTITEIKLTDENKIINNLIETAIEMNADESHLAIHNAKKTNHLTAVVSVYNGIKPAHMVLNELYDWAKENNPDVKDRIDQLTEDLSWNVPYKV